MQDAETNMARYVRMLLERPAEMEEETLMGQEDNAMTIAKAVVDKAKLGDLQAIKEVRALAETTGHDKREGFEMPARMMAEKYLLH